MCCKRAFSPGGWLVHPGQQRIVAVKSIDNCIELARKLANCTETLVCYMVRKTFFSTRQYPAAFFVLRVSIRLHRNIYSKRNNSKKSYRFMFCKHTCMCMNATRCLQHKAPPVHPGLPGPSASEITTLWRYTNLFIIIVIIIF